MAFANTIVKCPKYPLQNVTRMNQQFRAEFHEALDEILDSGNLILGKKVDEFEIAMLNYIGTKYCLGTSSGTASLELALTFKFLYSEISHQIGTAIQASRT